MNQVDRKCPGRLATNEAGLLGPLGEPCLWKEAIEIFEGKLRWRKGLVAIGSLAGGVFAVVSALYFFHAENVREMVAWAGASGWAGRRYRLQDQRLLSVAKERRLGRSSRWSCTSPAWRIR